MADREALLPPAALRPWPGWYLNDRGWLGEEPLVLGEVLHSQRGRHDEQLQRQVPLGNERPGDPWPPGAGNTDGRVGADFCPALLVSSLAPQPAPQPLFWVPKIQEKVEVHGSGLLKEPLRSPRGTSMAVQWLGLSTSTAGDQGSIPGRGTKILQAVCRGKKQTKA